MNGTSSYFFRLLLIVSFPWLLEARQPQTQSAHGLRSAFFLLSLSDTSYQLPREFILENSEVVFVDSTRQLLRTVDYTIDYRYGLLKFSPPQLHQILSDSVTHSMRVFYRALPIEYKREYSLRQAIVRKDSVGKKQIAVASMTQKPFADDMFGSSLQKSGSIVRGFTVGSNRDLTLNSGFRMQLAGRLSPDVDVVAALTDENSPIQPEGTTKTLREVDKVFVELRSAKYTATLGDFNLEVGQKEGGEFGRLFRKLQGARGVAAGDRPFGLDGAGSFSVTGATARGKYNTNYFQGVEGTQGPYRLTGRNGERRLIVIAGSERVYLNGESTTRGELNDYVIDYASGEVTFTSRRLITNASRITIDFEYSDRQFTRNLLGVMVSGLGFEKSFNFNASFIQEADDPDSPLDVPLDETALGILRQSGSDRLKASLPGIRNAGRDTATGFGKGQYMLRDTVINTRAYPILVYAPGDSLALYSATFSPVDNVPRDSAGYDRIGAGRFQFAGLGKGSYMPVQFLPLPQLHRLFDMNGQANLSREFSVSGEYAVSTLDSNRLSPLDDQNSAGKAFKFSIRLNPKRATIGGTNLGELDFVLTERFVDKRFVSPDRLNEVEFNRKWNLEAGAGTDEEIQEASLLYRPASALTGSFAYGSLNRPGEVQSARTQTELVVSDSSFPSARYRIERIKTENVPLGETSTWIRQLGTADYPLGGMRPGLRIETETRLTVLSGTDSVRPGSFRFIELAPRLSTGALSNLSASAEFQIRTEDSASGGSLMRASRSLTQLYSVQLENWQSFSSALAVSLRNTDFTQEFKRGNANSEVILVRSQSRYAPWQRAVETDLYYEFASQRSARLERVFVRVAKGSGNYRSRGDLNGNGIADENEFELTRFDGDYIVLYLPSDDLSPVVDLKTSVRLRFQPARLMRTPASSFERTVKAVSTETYVRIDEKSTEPDTKQIYLLNFRRFQSDQTTISGSNQLTQDLFLFENSPDLSFRFRFSERRGLLQLVSAVERSYLKERSVRIRSQLMAEVGNQTDFTNKIDRVLASSPSLRERDLEMNSLSSDFSYRPEPQWELGFNFGATQVVNYFQGQDATADVNEQGLRIVYAFLGAGQLRSEIKREEVTLTNAREDPLRPFPYEFTAGKTVGRSLLWQLAFEYRISQNMQVSMNYNGRSEGGRTPIHTARAEARAFF